MDVGEILNLIGYQKTNNLAILIEQVSSLIGYCMEILKLYWLLGKKDMERKLIEQIISHNNHLGNTYPINCWLKADTDDEASRIERFLLLLDTKGKYLNFIGCWAQEDIYNFAILLELISPPIG